jgi:hypothetical protein
METPKVVGLALAGAVLVAGIGIGLASGPRTLARRAGEPPWAADLRAAHVVLSDGDPQAAEAALDTAYGEALGSADWAGLLEVGDAYRRLSAVGRVAAAIEAKACRAYADAASAAHRRASAEGLRRVADTVAAWGNQEAALEIVFLAEDLGPWGPEASILTPVGRLASLAERCRAGSARGD